MSIIKNPFFLLTRHLSIIYPKLNDITENHLKLVYTRFTHIEINKMIAFFLEVKTLFQRKQF